MANEQNLKPYKKGEVDIEKQKERARLGGIARGKKMRERRAIKELMLAWGDEKPTKALQEVLKGLGVDVSDLDTIGAILSILKIKMGAKSTSVKDVLSCLEFYCKYTGQEPATKTELVNAEGDSLFPSIKVEFIDPNDRVAEDTDSEEV